MLALFSDKSLSARERERERERERDVWLQFKLLLTSF